MSHTRPLARRTIIGGVLSLLMPVLAQAEPLAERAAADLRAWGAAVGMPLVDAQPLPETGDIRVLAAFVSGLGYWEAPVVSDPWGRE